MTEEKNSQNKILEFVNNNFNLLVIAVLIFGFILRLKYLTINQAVWFDEAVYMSAAKNWAFNIPYQLHFVRPPLLPFIWAIFYNLGAGEFTFRIIMLLFSLVGLFLTYLIGKLLFNKYVGLIAMILTSFHYMNLFYTARLLTGIPSLTLWLLTIYFFWKGYVEKKGNYLYLMGFTFILSILMRFPAGILGLILLLFLLLTEGFKFLKNKKLWLSVGIFFVVLAPYAIWYYKNYEKIAILGAGAYYGGQIVFRKALSFIPTILNPAYLFITALLIGLGIILFNLVVGYDLIRKDEKLKKQLFIFLWILLTFSYFAFYAGIIEDRYFFYLFPAFFIIIGWVMVKINNILKKYYKFLGIIVIILLISFSGYKQLSHADQLIKVKSNSYIQFRQAGEWIKTNSDKDDSLVASGEPFFVYYAERKSYWYPSTEKEFLDFLQEKKPKFMILTATESSPEYTYSWPQNNPNKATPIQGYFFDTEKTQPAVVIYKLIYNGL